MTEFLKINRLLNLSKSADQRDLCEAANDDPELLSLIDGFLDEYLRIFPDAEWQRVYSGGMISVRIGDKGSTGFHIKEMLILTRTLCKLKVYQGYEKLLLGFRNPTQINSTYFETVVAGWCADRAVSLALEFSPEVAIKGGYKHPEFLWHTELGDIYCECKRANLLESAWNKKANRLLAELNTIYENYEPWDTSLRLDVRFASGTSNKIQARFKNVVAQASAALRADAYQSKEFIEGDVSAVLRSRDEPFSYEKESIIGYRGKTETVSKTLQELTFLSLTMSLVKYRQEAVLRLLKDAKTQLPPDSNGAVFIDIGGYEAAPNKLMSLLGHPAYEYVPWVSTWDHDEMTGAVWRNNQPFGDRLLLARA